MSMPLWALIAGLVVSVLGIGASAYGQHRANETNVQLNRENNQLQQQLSGQANQWNIDQWNRENVYNSPSSQVARLAGANLNPAMIYGNGNLVNSASASPQATMANTQAARVQNPLEHLSQVDPLTVAQVANLNAQTRKLDSETKYQDYMNQIEDQLSKVPISQYGYTDEDGVHIVATLGNARVEMAKSQLRMLGLSEDGLQYQLNDLAYDVAVKIGSMDGSLSSEDFKPYNQPNYDSASAALRGDNKVRQLSAEIADIGYKAAQAEKAGREAYAEWLSKHKDEPLVKLALTLQGFFQSSGITLPSVSGSVSSSDAHGVRKWFFGSN